MEKLDEIPRGIKSEIRKASQNVHGGLRTGNRNTDCIVAFKNGFGISVVPEKYIDADYILLCKKSAIVSSRLYDMALAKYTELFVA